MGIIYNSVIAGVGFFIAFSISWITARRIDETHPALYNLLGQLAKIERVMIFFPLEDTFQRVFLRHPVLEMAVELGLPLLFWGSILYMSSRCLAAIAVWLDNQ
jgi:hypothetical protein